MVSLNKKLDLKQTNTFIEIVTILNTYFFDFKLDISILTTHDTSYVLSKDTNESFHWYAFLINFIIPSIFYYTYLVETEERTLLRKRISKVDFLSGDFKSYCDSRFFMSFIYSDDILSSIRKYTIELIDK
jgi:hypothetical protein